MKKKYEIYEVLQKVASYSQGQINRIIYTDLKYYNRLTNIDEVRTQFCRILMSENRLKESLQYLTDIGIMDKLIKDFSKMCNMEQPTKYHTKDVFGHTVDVILRGATIEHKLAGLLHDIGKIYTYTCDSVNGIHFYGHQEYSYNVAKKFLKKLKFSTDVINRISYAVKYHMTWKDKTVKNTTINKYIKRFGKDNLIFFIELALNDSKHTKSQSHIHLLEYIEYVKNYQDPLTVKLPLNGHDIMKEFNCNGKTVGKYKEILTEEIKNNPDMNYEMCITFLRNKIKDEVKI